MWGLKGGKTSSDSAFDHNLEQEIGNLLGEHTATVLLDMTKCFDMVKHDALLQEARALGYPLRLAWMLLEVYCQPRRIRAYGSNSRATVAVQGVIAGCSHATYLLYLLTYRAVRRAAVISPVITPRTLVDDVGFQLVSPFASDLRMLGTVASDFADDALTLGLVLHPKKSARVAGSTQTRLAIGRLLGARPGTLQPRAVGARGLRRFPQAGHMRNLGHELHGTRVRRTVEKGRLQALRERRHRFGILRRAAGLRVSTLWRTGAMPSVAHGAGVSGLPDAPLRELRNFAAVLNGAPGTPHVGVTAYLITHRDDHYDPIYGATLDLVMRYAGWVWDGRTSPSRLRRAWDALQLRHGESLTWQHARGPLASTILTLRRIGWDLVSPHVVKDDVGQTFDLHQICPADLKVFLCQGVQRWQHERLQRHWYTNQGAPIWHRGLRHAVAGVTQPRRLEALKAHWADNLPIPPRRDMKLQRAMRPCQACGAALCQDTCWGHVFLDCPGLFTGSVTEGGTLSMQEVNSGAPIDGESSSGLVAAGGANAGHADDSVPGIAQPGGALAAGTTPDGPATDGLTVTLAPAERGPPDGQVSRPEFRPRSQDTGLAAGGVTEGETPGTQEPQGGVSLDGASGSGPDAAGCADDGGAADSFPGAAPSSGALATATASAGFSVDAGGVEESDSGIRHAEDHAAESPQLTTRAVVSNTGMDESDDFFPAVGDEAEPGEFSMDWSPGHREDAHATHSDIRDGGTTGVTSGPRDEGTAGETSGPPLGPTDSASARKRDGFFDIPERLLEVREHLRRGGLGSGAPNFDQTYLVFGAPEPPLGLPPLSTISREVLRWGDHGGQWGPVSYTDGSGYESSLPEVRRCGQAVVQLDDRSWLPVRAVYGPLPYLVQTVGRAERYAIKLGLDMHADHHEFVTDLLSLVDEGRRWSADLCAGRARHARVWRDIFGAARRRTISAPPSFRWTPAHRDASLLLDSDALEVRDWIGNAWADFFARLGATQHTVAKALAESVSEALKQHRQVLEFISYACLRVVRFKRYGVDAEVPRPLWQHSAPVVFGRVDDHQLYYCAELQQHRCRRCNASASTRASLHTIRSGSLRRCSPTTVEQAMAAAYFRNSAYTWHLIGDDRVALAIDSLTRQVDMEPGPSGPEDAAMRDGIHHAALRSAGDGGLDLPAPAPDAADSDLIEAFATLGHRVFYSCGVYCCERCAGVCDAARPATARKLRRLCEGLSRNAGTRREQTAAIARVRRGLPARQRGGAQAAAPR